MRKKFEASKCRLDISFWKMIFRKERQWNPGQPERFDEHLLMENEAGFHMSGIANRQLFRWYAPRGQRPSEYVYEWGKHSEKLSLRIGLCGDGKIIIGRIFFDENLNGLSYPGMLNERIILDLRIIYGNGINRVWWMQDWASEHKMDLFWNRLATWFQWNYIS